MAHFTFLGDGSFVRSHEFFLSFSLSLTYAQSEISTKPTLTKTQLIKAVKKHKNSLKGRTRPSFDSHSPQISNYVAACFSSVLLFQPCEYINNSFYIQLLTFPGLKYFILYLTVFELCFYKLEWRWIEAELCLRGRFFIFSTKNLYKVLTRST